MKSAVVRIDREELAAIIGRAGNAGTPPHYTHSNPLVRELMWRRLDVLMRLSKAPPGSRVLDFGGGNGVLTPTLSRTFSEVVCVDRSPEMCREIVQARGLSNVRIHADDLAALALPSASFETIIASEVLEHIPDYTAVVLELRRLLKPGGELLVSAPSENLLYAFARVAFGYQKPADHYHTAAGIEHGVASMLPLALRRCYPVDVPQLAFFWLMRFEAAGGASA